jgi:hypothetical protein
MTTATAHPAPAAVPARMRAGASVGAMRDVEDAPRRLHLAAKGFPALMLLAGAAVLVVGAVRLAAPQVFGSPLDPRSFVHDWGFILLCVAFGAAVVGVPGYGRSVTFDGSSRTVTRRGGFRQRTSADRLRGLVVALGHLGPNEVLQLAVAWDRGDEVLAHAPSDRRGLALPSVAARAAELLGLPLVRVASVVQGGPEVRAALDRVAPPPEGPAATGDGRDLVINCPACKSSHVPAVSYDWKEQSHGFTRTTTWVKCLACGTSLYSKAPPEELFGRTPEQLQGVVVFRLSLIKSMTALLAAGLCLFPYVGFGMALLGTLINWRTRGWPRLTSRVALAVGAVTTAALIIFLRT